MKQQNNPIRRALEQVQAGTHLPDGFTHRLMERIERESKRRERIETCLLAAAGVACLAAIIAGAAWYFDWEPTIAPHLPDIPIPSGEQLLNPLYLYVALVFLGLAGVDRCLHLRHARRAEKKALS